MDRYGDLYYRASAAPAGFYAPYYGTERRSAYTLPAVDPLYSSSYARVPLDAHAGYSVPDLLLPQRYSGPVHSPNPKRRPRRIEARAASPPSLGPRKKPFKKVRNSAPHVANQTPKKSSQQKTSLQKGTGNPSSGGKPSAATLAEETRELHKLFRTGVDRVNGKKGKDAPVNNVDGTVDKAGKKRKAAAQKKEEELSSAKKKQKGKKVAQRKEEEPLGGKKKKKQKGKNKKLAKGQSTAVETSAPKQPSTTAKQPALTEEESKAALELQTTACNSVREFLGISETKEADVPEASKESENAKDSEAEKVDAIPGEDPKSPEEEKVLKEQGYNFFTKLFQDNQDLRKLYLDRKDAGTFECLVCSSVSSDSSKKFTTLTSLLMHTSMRRMNRPEHLGYGQAVCDVLGWDSLRGPKRPVKQAKENGGELATVEAEKPDKIVKTLPEESTKPPEEKTEATNMETAKPEEEETEEESREPTEAAEEEKNAAENTEDVKVLVEENAEG